MALHRTRAILKPRASDARRVAKRGWLEKALFVSWLFAFFELEWFIGGAAKRFPTPFNLLLLLAAVASFKVRKEALPWPLLGVLGLHAIWVPFAPNEGMALSLFQTLYPRIVLFVVTVSLVRDPQQAITLFKMFAVSFIWYGLQGIPSGTVSWHSELSEEDAFGPAMSMAVGFGYFFAEAAPRGWWKRAGLIAAGVGLIGVVASFARGAFLALVVSVVWIWVRSRRKWLTLGIGLAGIAVGLIAIRILYPGGAYWAEMSTIRHGSEDETGKDRVVMWNIAMSLWRQAPIQGLGPGCFGVVAAQSLSEDWSREAYHRPIGLYGRSLHSIYVQMLTEQGIIGALLWLILLFDFELGQLRARRSHSLRVWRALDGRLFDVVSLSRGLELAMVGYLVSGLFYGLWYSPWFWTLITLGRVLSVVSKNSVRRVVVR